MTQRIICLLPLRQAVWKRDSFKKELISIKVVSVAQAGRRYQKAVWKTGVLTTWG